MCTLQGRRAHHCGYRGRSHRQRPAQQRPRQPAKPVQAVPQPQDGERDRRCETERGKREGRGQSFCGTCRDTCAHPNFRAAKFLKRVLIDGRPSQAEPPKSGRRHRAALPRSTPVAGASACFRGTSSTFMATKRPRRHGVEPYRADPGREHAAHGGGPLRARADVRVAWQVRAALRGRRGANGEHGRNAAHPDERLWLDAGRERQG